MKNFNKAIRIKQIDCEDLQMERSLISEFQKEGLNKYILYYRIIYQLTEILALVRGCDHWNSSVLSVRQLHMEDNGRWSLNSVDWLKLDCWIEIQWSRG